MYRGDQLSKKETHILPPTSDFDQSQTEITMETLAAEKTSLLVTYNMYSPVSMKTEGTIRKAQYPTAYFLDKSKMYALSSEKEIRQQPAKHESICWENAFKPVTEEDNSDDGDQCEIGALLSGAESIQTNFSNKFKRQTDSGDCINL